MVILDLTEATREWLSLSLAHRMLRRRSRAGTDNPDLPHGFGYDQATE